MRVLILAAGSGERFRALGYKTPKPLLRFCGLSLLERTIRTAAKAGASEILVVVGSEAEQIQKELAPRVAALPVRWILNKEWPAGNGTSMLAAIPYVAKDPVLVLMSDHLVFASTLRTAWQAALSSKKSTMAVDYKIKDLSDPEDATKVQVEEGSIVALDKKLAIFNAYDTGISVCYPDYFDRLVQSSKDRPGSCSHSDGMRALVKEGRLKAFDIGSDRWEDVDSPTAHKAAEKILFMSLQKPTDGFMSRLVERRISGFISWALMNTSVTPNMMTFFVIGVGISAAYFFAQPDLRLQVLGALLFWCSSFLDGCDGELARLKFMESRLGGWLDIWADNVVHICVFIGIGIGLFRHTSSMHWIYLGISAALGVLISVSWVSWQTLRKKKGEGPLYTSTTGQNDRLSQFADALSRRDFIFFTMFITLFGWLPFFLWAAAIGSHIYWIVLIGISLKGR
jgi:1L-myo-inositol 1-phosphate cytidylyltransferase / CDP-L-myo-inositol myo-inositolphosphotransferase